MSAELPFMAWHDHLPEVGDPLRSDRAKLQELAEQAAELPSWSTAPQRCALACTPARPSW